MKCEKCGKEDSTAKEYKWILAKELKRVYAGRDSAMLQDKYMVTYGEFTPVSVSVCPQCVQRVKRSRLLKGLIFSTLAAICSALFIINGLKPGNQVDTFHGIFLPAGGVLVFLFICLVFMNSRKEEIIASGELRSKDRKTGLMRGFDKRFTMNEYEAMVRANEKKNGRS